MAIPILASQTANVKNRKKSSILNVKKVPKSVKVKIRESPINSKFNNMRKIWFQSLIKFSTIKAILSLTKAKKILEWFEFNKDMTKSVIIKINFIW